MVAMKPGGWPEALVTMLVLLLPGVVLILGGGLLWGRWGALGGMAGWMAGVCVLVAIPPPKS